jgi:hypothetical protein
MTDPGAWHQANDEYLASAVAWLRLRLERITPAERAPSMARFRPPETPQPSVLGRLLGRRTTPAADPVRALLPSRSPTSRDRDVIEAATSMARMASDDPPPALVLLARRFGLSDFEREVLLLGIGAELDTRIGPLCARAQDDPARPYPTFALAMALFDEPTWDVLSPERPLRYWRLIELAQTGTQPLTASAFRVDERVLNFAKGLNYLDDRLASLVTPVDPSYTALQLPPSQQAAVDGLVRRLEHPAEGTPPGAIQLLGADRASKEIVASAVASALGLHLYRLPSDGLPSQPQEVEVLARLWQRETILLPLALYLEQREGEAGAAGQAAATLARFLSRLDRLCFLDTRDLRSDLGASSVMLDVNKPLPAEQRDIWAAALGTRAGENPGRLSAQFNLSLGVIHQVARGALALAAEEPAALAERLWSDCLARTRPRLDLLAQRIDARATWEDLVLPAVEIALLRQIVAQVAQRSRVYEDWGFGRKMNRGLGISALFSGESGTGKTMAAEVIANDLRLQLYRIDLSALVSKYIGETEKNVRQCFDGAEDGGAILFFDEADAIFGKRSEVKDSHDRYANIEINYLLQRMESYRGLAILATNMKTALDPAFLRRLRFIVDFPFPGPAERRAIWRRAFPADAEVHGIEVERLARLPLTGGSIHNTALNAAFLAAHAGEAVTMPRVLEAARVELRKLDRPINEADFRWLEPKEVVA